MFLKCSIQLVLYALQRIAVECLYSGQINWSALCDIYFPDFSRGSLLLFLLSFVGSGTLVV